MEIRATERPVDAMIRGTEQEAAVILEHTRTESASLE